MQHLTCNQDQDFISTDESDRWPVCQARLLSRVSQYPHLLDRWHSDVVTLPMCMFVCVCYKR